MSHLVVRDKPTAAQLYLDEVLDAVLTAKGLTPEPATRASVTATEILLHCFKERPNELFMINAATGAEITNEQHLKKTISFSRALTAKGAKGKHAMLLMRNHEDTVATYFATLFTGVIPFMVDPNSTVYELTYFLELVEPSFVFYDQEFDDSLKEALKACKDLKTEVLMVIGPGVLQQFTEGFSDDIDSFQVAPAAMDDPLLMVPTSGSTGIPKAAILTHWGIFSHLPCLWSYHSRFPTPTARMMVLTTIQWVTFTLAVTTSIVYHIPIIITPKKITPEHVIEILEKYRPTWGYLTPAFAVTMIPQARHDQLSSLETLYMVGSPTTPELMALFKVAPEEVERVIGSVPGVYESVVCLSEKGPVAAVVLEPQATVTRELIKNTVAAALSDHKRLHGGIVFVESLPHTHSGKIKRIECSELIADLFQKGECY